MRRIGCKELIRIFDKAGVTLDANWLASLGVNAVQHIAFNPAISPPMHTAIAVNPYAPINFSRNLRRVLRAGLACKAYCQDKCHNGKKTIFHFGKFLHFHSPHTLAVAWDVFQPCPQRCKADSGAIWGCAPHCRHILLQRRCFAAALFRKREQPMGSLS